MKNHIFVILLNFGSTEDTIAATSSVLAGTLKPKGIIIVDNLSTPESQAILNKLEEKHRIIHCLFQNKNHGFAEGVNIGIRYAIKHNAEYIALLNNDAIAEKKWLEKLLSAININEDVGIVTSKITNFERMTLDSTGNFYTMWGLPYPRGRGEENLMAYDNQTEIFSASGGASLYRTKMLQDIGLFDKNLFAYYEDVDISFRAQLAGWSVQYEPSAVVRHKIGASSSKISGFTTYQTFKNLPLLFIKNVPLGLLLPIGFRFFIIYNYFLLGSIKNGTAAPAFKGFVASMFYLPKKIWQRRMIQANRKITLSYLRSMIVKDLPPGQKSLQKLRTKFHL